MSYKIDKHLTVTNKGSAGANKPEWIVFHFVGATGQAWDNAKYFYSTYRGASAHYFVDDKDIVQVVEDNRPAWHVGDGSRTGQGKYNGYRGYGATNNNSIGIELCLDVNSHSSVWHMRFHPETLKRAEWLIKQKQKQYNIPNERVIRHFDASGKLCPGNWQYNNWQQWWDFKDRLAGVKGNKTTTPSTNDGKPKVSGKTYLVKTGDTLSKIARQHGVTVAQLTNWNDLENPSLIFPETYLFVAEPKKEKPKTDIDRLARDTIAGKYGNGDERKRRLGSNYNKVMQRVNELLGVSSKPAPKPKAKSLDTLVSETLAGKYGNGDERKRRLGSNYQAVMDVINGKATTTTTSRAKSIDTLVKETLAGKYGNGDERKRRLGSNYQAVMDVINGKASTSSKGKITKKLVDDVIAGKYGNGAERERRLRNAGYDPQAVQREVNKRF